MKPRVAGYFRRGFTMSRRARISHKNHEHPMTWWVKELGLDKKTLKNMLVCVGIHHTGMYAKRTLFYRLPKWNRVHETERFFEVFFAVPPTKKKFFQFMDRHGKLPIFRLPENIHVPESTTVKRDRYIKLSDLVLQPDKMESKF